MGQRVVTSLNHLDFKKIKKIKIKIIIIIMQIKKGRKKHTGDHFLVTRRTHVGRRKKEKEKNIGEEQERHERRKEELLLTERGRD